jgi:hypothetical protein
VEILKKVGKLSLADKFKKPLVEMIFPLAVLLIQALVENYLHWRLIKRTVSANMFSLVV